MKREDIIAAMQKVFNDQRYSRRTVECYTQWFDRFFVFSKTCSDIPLVPFVAPSLQIAAHCATAQSLAY